MYIHNILYKLINSKRFHRKEKLNREKILYLSNNCVIIVFNLKTDNKTKIIVKKVTSKSKILSNNSFFIGRFVTNKLKNEIQNFRYMYGYEIYRNKQVLYLEYIRGRNFKNFIQSNMYNTDKHKIDLFHNFLLQIILCLEYIQDKFKFVHYDLHLENIMISPCDNLNPFVFNLSNQTIELKNFGYLVYFIDFDFSISSLTKKPFNVKKIMKYGFTGIFLSGTDILRFLFSLQKKVEWSKDYFGLMVKTFLLYVFTNYYQIYFEPGDSNSLSIHEKLYFCMMNQKQIFYTPLSLYYFLFENHVILNIDRSNFITPLQNDDYQINKNIYIPRLTSSKDAIEIFIRKYENNTITRNPFDTFLSRVVISLQELLEFYEKNDLQKIELDPKMKDIKYLK